MSDFAGQWFTTFGPMKLEQSGDAIHGVYRSQGTLCRIDGEVADGQFRFQYREPDEQGSGWFQLARHGRFAGRYQADGNPAEHDWTGQREFDGIWESTFGRLRLVQEEDRVFGFYEGVGRSTVEGKIVDGRLRFHYKEPSASGEGWFQIDEGLVSFTGEWRVDGASSWAPWVGKRILPQSNRTWLLVLEAHWQRSIGDQEYSFGGMVGEFLARYQHIAVRHRFFDDEEGLERWCRELLYFPEPAVVVVASHGTPEGINVGGHTINSRLVIDYLRHAENLQLLHFSSCLVLKEAQPGDFAKRIEKTAPFPISGYTTSVDWGGSAVLEFTYLDMILGKGLPPADAARQLLKLVRFAGDDPLPGSPYLPAGFRFFGPDESEPIGGSESAPLGESGVFLA
jgi:uncharacterized cupin superfamily protein